MQLAPFTLERFFARYEFSAPYLLCTSDCESLAVADLLALEPDATAQLHGLWLGYTESAGAPALREAISDLYQQIDPGQVLVHSGAEEAIFNFMHAMLEPGDHVIVQWPGYQSLAEVARSVGADVTLWCTHHEDGWALDMDDLRGMLRPSTRLVVINAPHNPTGYLPSAHFATELAALADNQGFLIFGDEVYRGLEADPAEMLPAFCDLTERAVSLGVMSKTYGLAGLRIGWIATRNAEIYSRMAAFKDYTTICNSAPSEFLATLALRQRERLVARNTEIIAQNMTLLDDFFQRHDQLFTWQRPKAGPIAFPKVRNSADSAPFCRRLVDEAGVLLLPGNQIDPAYAAHFRLGFGRANMAECLRELDLFLARDR